MKTKRCPGCLEVTPDFQACPSRPDGLDVYCRTCRRRQARERYARYTADPERLEQRRKIRRRKSKRLTRDRGVPGTKNWARKQVLNAVYRGKLVKPDACEMCGTATSKAQLHGHHADYARPLDVEWLCRSCHRAVHDPVSRSGSHEGGRDTRLPDQKLPAEGS